VNTFLITETNNGYEKMKASKSFHKCILLQSKTQNINKKKEMVCLRSMILV